MLQIPSTSQEFPLDLSNEWASPTETTMSDVQVARARMASLGLTAMEPFFAASPRHSTLLAEQIWALTKSGEKKPLSATPSKVSWERELCLLHLKAETNLVQEKLCIIKDLFFSSATISALPI
ncbi:hypothetical protein CBOM_05882 [Ceraceosorus bombacis]|uniref:Uncharacterized protein n=1 Tax=Ceraceosorus bombacis TaxID=401625 RepID=A0A0P1BIQ5_9BASI|nr:hypothetical protein CBOM_05882 [Ceraceosorus bombacis]